MTAPVLIQSGGLIRLAAWPTVTPPFLPSDLTGLMLWYDASQESFSDNDPVGTWTDWSGNGSHATQATTGSKPTFKTNIINGKPALYFTTDDYLTIPDVLGGIDGNSAELFAVLKRDVDPPASSADAGIWALGGGATDDGDQSVIPWTDGNVYDKTLTASRKNTGDPTDSLASPALYNVISTGSEWTLNINTVQHFTTGTNLAAAGANATIGSDKQHSIFYKGYFAELIICSAKQSSGDRASMTDALASKWAV